MTVRSTVEVAPGARTPLVVRRFTLTVLEGPAAGKSVESNGETAGIGSHELNQLVIDDPTVSRFHCEIRVSADGGRVRDLGSRNGTVVDGLTVFDALLRDGSVLRLGSSTVAFRLQSGETPIELSADHRFGNLVGDSAQMRAVFALLGRVAAADITVLLEGETGSGKSQAADAIHAQSRRKDGPFVVVDCASLSATVLESELFGHERGAFTGADSRRVGAFEEATDGTVFLDEIGEMPLAMQPKLLRVIEARQIRRVGSNQFRPVDVRMIAATHRDLRSEVNAGRFRADLYFRLAVAKIEIPPLRHRPQDVPATIEQLLSAMHVDEARRAAITAPEMMAHLQRGAWPGNVRELRNYLERLVVFERADPPTPVEESGRGVAIDASIPFAEARQAVLARFERGYLEALLAKFEHNIAAAAEHSGVDRGYLYKLLRRHGLKPGG